MFVFQDCVSVVDKSPQTKGAEECGGKLTSIRGARGSEIQHRGHNSSDSKEGAKKLIPSNGQTLSKT